MLTDNEIINLRKGDQRAFKKLFELMYPKLVARACRFVDEQTAKDIVQNLFLSYWEKKDIIETQNISAYLFRWIHNSCLNHLNHNLVRNRYEERIKLAELRIAYTESILEEENLFDKMESQQLKNTIQKLFSKMPKRSAEAFRLRFFNDFSNKEIAEIMKISPRTVETHITVSIRFFKQALKYHLPFLFMLYNMF